MAAESDDDKPSLSMEAQAALMAKEAAAPEEHITMLATLSSEQCGKYLTSLTEEDLAVVLPVMSPVDRARAEAAMEEVPRY